ncbi:homoserine O-acetyltransferase MetX [Luteococcus sp. Sow4_B9]|uniref:homoserine O-acetyltransferase MetX n=1 Tax=Luteococcus sp. Sow4_B9 TaxID=3438792 RepID=UPI003F996BC3
MIPPEEQTSGVGLVETRSAQLFVDEPLHLVGGEQLRDITVAYETYGELNEAADNAVFICHALTGDAHAAGWHEGARRPGWWDNLIGPGRPVDTNRWFVVCSNLLGGCSGTTGPGSTNPETGRPWGLDFPLLDISDFVEVHRELGAHLGVARWHAVVGGSMGGMQALDWSLRYPEEMCNAAVIASSSRLTAQNIAFSAVGRAAIMRDENFHDGQFAAVGDNPDVGLAIARMMAHITYTSEEGFQTKFGRRPQHEDTERGFGVDFAVESYLEHQGEVFLSRFDALSYLYLTRVMDYFDPFARPDALARVQAHPVSYLVVSFDTDWRFSTRHSRRIVRELEGGRLPVTFRDIRSPWGHDSFLLDVPVYHETVRAFLESESASHPHAHRRATGGQQRAESKEVA